MRLKSILFSIFVMLYALGASAQSDVTTFTVHDPSGQPYSNGTVSYSITPLQTYNWNGSPLPAQYYAPQTVSLDVNGTGTFTVPRNDLITPIGSAWKLSVCPSTSANCTSLNVPLITSSQDISATINSAISNPNIAAEQIPRAYNDAEIAPLIKPGGLYYNVGTTNPGYRYYNGAGFTALSAGGGGGYITSLTTNSYSGAANVAGGVLNIPVYTGYTGLFTVGHCLTVASASPLVIQDFGSVCGSGGGGGSPGGNQYDIQINNGGGTFAGTNSKFFYQPNDYGTGAGLLTLEQNLSLPGWNLGGTYGSWGPRLFTSDYSTKYSQGLWTMFGINNARNNGNGDFNGIDGYFHNSGNWSDANGEGFTGFRNYMFIDEAPYSAPITGTANNNTQVTLNAGSGSNAPNWGNGRVAIDLTAVTAATIVSNTVSNNGSGSYATVTFSGTPFTGSVSGNLSTAINITPTSANPAVAETLSLTSVTGTGCAVNDLVSFLPNGPPGQIETVRATAVGTLSGGAQTVSVNMRNSQAAGSTVYCHGTQGFIDVPSIDYNNIKIISSIIGTTANNVAIVAEQGSGGIIAPSVPAGAANIYGGAQLIDSTTPGTGAEDGNGFNVLAENNSFVAGSVGHTIEVEDGPNTIFGGYKSQVVSNNPFLQGDHFYVICPVGTACGDYQGGVNQIKGMAWYNNNAESSYNCPGCGGSWNGMPINFMTGTFGPLAIYNTAPDYPIIEEYASGGHNGNIIQIDDAGAAAYWSWTKSSNTWSFVGNNFVFAAGGGGAGNVTNFTLKVNNGGTPTDCLGRDVNHNVFAYPCTLGSVNSGTAGQLAFYSATGTAVSGNTHVTDSGTQIQLTEPLSITGTSNGIDFAPLALPAPIATHGGIYVGTDGNMYSSDNGAAYARLCNSTNAVCGGSSGIADTTFTTSTTAVPATSCDAGHTVTWTGLTTAMSLTLPTATVDLTADAAWGVTGTLYIRPWISAANTLSYKLCNSGTAAMTPGASVTWTIGAK